MPSSPAEARRAMGGRPSTRHGARASWFERRPDNGRRRDDHIFRAPAKSLTKNPPRSVKVVASVPRVPSISVRASRRNRCVGRSRLARASILGARRCVRSNARSIVSRRPGTETRRPRARSASPPTHSPWEGDVRRRLPPRSVRLPAGDDGEGGGGTRAQPKRPAGEPHRCATPTLSPSPDVPPVCRHPQIHRADASTLARNHAARPTTRRR